LALSFGRPPPQCGQSVSSGGLQLVRFRSENSGQLLPKSQILCQSVFAILCDDAQNRSSCNGPRNNFCGFFPPETENVESSVSPSGSM
jgi:hypothetical protein